MRIFFQIFIVALLLTFFLSFKTVDTSLTRPVGLDKKREVAECIAALLWHKMHHFMVAYDESLVIETLRQFSEGRLTALDENGCYLKLAGWMFEDQQKQAAEQLKLADEFLKQLPHKTGFVELEANKLYYEILKEGHGQQFIRIDSTPLMHMTETTLSGEISRDTRLNSMPIRIIISETIDGFYRGVLGMHQGERRRLYVHPNLAYHKLSRAAPNQLIIFDVQVEEF